MDDDRNMMSDGDLDRLLNVASHPQRPLGAEQRLMKRLSAEPQVHTSRPKRGVAWISALPLAASLLLGVYLGQSGYEPAFLGTQDTAALTDENTDMTTGLEELEVQADTDGTT